MVWDKEEPNGLDELKRRLWALSNKPAAFRGQADCTWALRSLFDRRTRSETPRANRMKRERKLLDDFANKARLFLSERERLSIDHFTHRPTGFDVWSVMAIARHYGLATRALDWTSSVLAAAYFAAIGEPEKSGAVWWFDQTELESVLHRSWDEWGVPKRDGDPREERAIEAQAFREQYEHLWLTKIHFPVPFPRMEAQRAFLTICSQLGVNHCEAIDKLGVVRKGKFVIPRDLKTPLLAYLDKLGVSAHSLLYPGADVTAQEINADYS